MVHTYALHRGHRPACKQSMAPRFDEIELELAAVSEFRDTPAGNVRIAHACKSVHSVRGRLNKKTGAVA